MRLRLLWEDWREVLNSTTKNTLTAFISLLINLVIACVIVWAVSNTGVLLKGYDSMYHVYRGDWIMKSIEAGEVWPLYNPVWYSGVELMRYWPPVAAYLMAFCQFIAKSIPWLFTSNYVFDGFAVYCGIIYLIGAVTWNIAGFVKNRPVLGVLFGIMWFFMPQSMHVLFTEGNLPRSLIMVIFPLAFVIQFTGFSSASDSCCAGWLLNERNFPFPCAQRRPGI